MDPLTALGGAASAIAVLQLTQAIGKTLVNYYQTAREAREEIKYLATTLESLERILNYEVLKNTTSGTLTLLQAELDKLEKKLRIYDKASSKTKNFFMSIKWPFEKGEVNKMTKRIEGQKTALSVEVGATTFNISAATSTLLIQLDEEIRKARLDEHHRLVVEWLKKSVPDTSSYHNAARRKHEETTGEWLTSSDELQEWMKSKNSFLWLRGGAGAGKSILCSSVIEYLQDYSAFEDTDSLSVVTYWYFSFADTGTQNICNFFSSVIGDLCSQTLHLPDVVMKSYTRHNNGQQRPAAKALLQMFQSLVPGFDHVYLVVDALDECLHDQSREDLMKQIHEIAKLHLNSLHFFATSRDEIDLQDSFRQLKQHKISLEVLAARGISVQGDIEKFLDRQLQGPAYTKWNTSEKSVVKATLASQADGMFRLAALQLENLKLSKSPSMRQQALKQMPKTLDSFYDRMMNDIQEEYRDHVKKAFYWLAFSARQITLGQLAEAVVVNPTEPYFDLNARFDDYDAFLSIFPAGLVQTFSPDAHLSAIEPGSIDESPTSGSRFYSDFDSFILNHRNCPVQFAHYSVKEYLVSNRASSKFYSLGEMSGHLLISEICLSYIFYVDSVKLNTQSELAERFPLLYYACKCWPYHMRSLEEQASFYILEELLKKFLSSKSTRDLWLRFGLTNFRHRTPSNRFILFEGVLKFSHNSFGDFIQNSNYCYSKDYSGIDVVPSWLAFLGVSQALNTLHSSDGTTSLCNGQAKTEVKIGSILHAAALSGRLSIVKQLLSWNLEVDMPGGYFESALRAAAAIGSREIVELLLQQGSNPNLLGSRNGTALQIASHAGHLEVVKLLLGYGSDVNISDENSGTALHAAVAEGHLEIIHLLLSHGAKIDISGGRYKTALIAAIETRNLAIIQLFIDRGCDMNLKNPLHQAAKGNRVDIMELLYHNGSNIDALDESGRTVLHIAVKSRVIKMVTWILQKRCQLNVVNKYGQTAIQLAAKYHRYKTVSLLLEAGGEVNPVKGERESSLFAVIKEPPYFGVYRNNRDSLETIRILLAAGVDTNFLGHDSTALQLAKKLAKRYSSLEPKIFSEYYLKVIHMLEDHEMKLRLRLTEQGSAQPELTND